ncbi:porin [Flavobacterium sp. IMCC34518]|uniref:porin n=1 Tax=Flavobacterium sp. IMCC34518 TaxID=3003623 RepID=UPI002482EEC6|nr:porin [Flavobacterium sp. IMCC34518]
MKKYFMYAIMFFLPSNVIGQDDTNGQMEKQTNEGNQFETDSIKSLFFVSKESLFSDTDVIFNTRFAFDSNFLDGNHVLSSFNVNQFRFEIKGKIHDKVYFRFRNRYNREPIPGNLDNISRAVDIAFVTIDLSPTTNFTLGKLCADWGGWEFDLNPIDILAYNDIIENSDNFLVGAGIAHTFEDKKNSISFQILNSRTKTYEEQYGASSPPNLKPSEFPLAAVVNWRSSFFNGKIETTYSYSFFNEAQGAHMNYIALGNKFKARNFLLYYDFQYSIEGLDRKGIISGIIDSKYQYAAQKAVYMGNWIRAEYLVTPKINLLLTLMSNKHYWNDNPDPNGSSKLSNSYGIIPTIQYSPFKNFNMNFYLGYVARKFNYSSYAEKAFDVKDYNTGLLSFGIIAPFLVL